MRVDDQRGSATDTPDIRLVGEDVRKTRAAAQPNVFQLVLRGLVRSRLRDNLRWNFPG